MLDDVLHAKNNEDYPVDNDSISTDRSEFHRESNVSSSKSTTSFDNHKAGDPQEFDHHINGSYIKKIRERFEKSNEKINDEILRVNPGNVAQNILSDISKNLNRSSEPLIGKEDHKDGTSGISCMNIDGSVSSSKSHKVGSLKEMKKDRNSVVSHKTDDNLSVVTSRKIKKKKTKRFKQSLGRPICEENKISFPISNSPTSESKMYKNNKSKVVLTKTNKKKSRRKPFRAMSKEKRENSSSGNSRHSSQHCQRNNAENDLKIDLSKTYPKVGNADYYIYENDNVNKYFFNKIEKTSFEKLCGSQTSFNHLDSRDIEREILLKNLNLILHANGTDLGNSVKDDTLRYQSSRCSNNYEMPTIASQMKKVHRTFSAKQSDSSCRTPFVVGTSVSVTNNLYLLKQQISSKIKTYFMSTVHEEQLTGWNVNNLRLLVQGIEKFGGSTYKYRNVLRSKHLMNQQNEHPLTTASFENP